MTNASKGHLMNRGTLMVLKRLFVTALGAMGLGALAAGTALAQAQSPGDGNIPAPDLFDDQIACTMNLPGMAMRPTPTVVPMGEEDSPLDTLIGDGMTAIVSSSQEALDLGYVIPATGSSCGNATAGLTDYFVGAQDASIPMDVAEGYSAVFAEFMDVYGDPTMAGDPATGENNGAKGVLDAARRALAMATADTTAEQLETLQDAVDEALEEYNKQKAEFDAIASGHIYQAGVAEWMAQSAVTNAVIDYNVTVGEANKELSDLNDLDYVSVTVNDDLTVTKTSKYVPLFGDELIDTVVTIADGMASVPTVAALKVYANADGDNSAILEENGRANFTGTTSNFDSSRNLLIPTELDTTDRDGDGDITDYVPAIETGNFGVDDIRTRVDNYNIAAAALKKARDENGNVLLQPLYDEAYERAKAEAAYYNGVWADVLSDTTDQRTQDERDETHADYEDPYSISSQYELVVKSSNDRAAAELDLREKVAAREAATEAVVDAFQSPASFYDQLVARRQALKFAADKAVADADNPDETLTDAAGAAATALMEAEEAQANYQALYADASDPVQELIDELLTTDGDDGQALVDAISGSYDTANAAQETADQVAEDVAGLTGEGGDVAMNTAAIEKNAGDITALDGRVAMNEGEIWDADGNSRIDANENRIDANEKMIGENRGMIVTNAENITANAGNIATNTTMIGENRGMIETNADDIETNAGNIMMNDGRIAANRTDINQNTTDIASAMSSIRSNSELIGELSDDLDVVRAGVAASMALAGMPAINGRGISIGVGSFDGESAFAVGFQIQGEMASFKVGVTSASGATGASAGVGFQF